MFFGSFLPSPSLEAIDLIDPTSLVPAFTSSSSTWSPVETNPSSAALLRTSPAVSQKRAGDGAGARYEPPRRGETRPSRTDAMV